MVESYPHNNPAPDPNPISGMFVGRQREMADLKAALEDAISVRGGLVMLAGEPGIGKSRATQEIGAYAELRPEPTGVIPFPTSPPNTISRKKVHGGASPGSGTWQEQEKGSGGGGFLESLVVALPSDSRY